MSVLRASQRLNPALLSLVCSTPQARWDKYDAGDYLHVEESSENQAGPPSNKGIGDVHAKHPASYSFSSAIPSLIKTSNSTLPSLPGASVTSQKFHFFYKSESLKQNKSSKMNSCKSVLFTCM